MHDRLSETPASTAALPAVARMRADPPRHDPFPRMRSDFNPADLPAPMGREMMLLTHEMLGVGYATGTALAALQHGPLMPFSTDTVMMNQGVAYPGMRGMDLFAPRLRLALSFRGMTFNELAAALDRAHSSVSKWGVEITPPRPMRAAAAQMLGVTEAWLCGQSDEGGPSPDGAGNVREASPHVRPAPESTRGGVAAAHALSGQKETTR